MRDAHRTLLATASLLAIAAPGRADPTIGLLLHAPGSWDGYTLFEPGVYPTTYLIDGKGHLIHSWEHPLFLGAWPRILENGHLLRGSNPGLPVYDAPGAGGIIQELDWDGTLLWEFSYVNDDHRQHHDMMPLPNGNVLLVAWEGKSADEAIAAGRDPALLPDGEVWPEHVVEVEPLGANGGDIVWEWHAWDHLIQDFDSTKANYGVVADHPELIDLNFTLNGGADWLHANAIAYNAELDQIVISINTFSEFWIIDHSTTTEEAAGHAGGNAGRGGDILYRWGNPEAYDRGGPTERRLYRQHSTHWIAPGLPGAGHILLFNNGFGRPEGQYSSVEEIQTTVDANGQYPDPPDGLPHEPANATWTYTATPPEDLYSAIISSAQRLPNGNTLICDGTPTATFSEIDPQEEIVWLYLNPVGPDGPLVQGDPPVFSPSFRTQRYALDYVGFDGRDLTPGPPIELYPTSVVAGAGRDRGFVLRPISPNPFRTAASISFSLSREAEVSLRVFDVAGRRVATLLDRRLEPGEHHRRWAADRLPAGVYHVVLRVDGAGESRKVSLVR